MFSFLRARFGGQALPASGQRLPYPVAPCPPIAVFSTRFEAAKPAVYAACVSELVELEVETAAAPVSVFRAIDRSIWRPSFPVIVLSDMANGMMRCEDRDYIWDTFGVPSFEYLLDAHGRIVAQECEAHDGLHLHSSFRDSRASITSEPCPCGKNGARLQGTNAIIEEAVPRTVFGEMQEWRNWQTHQT